MKMRAKSFNDPRFDLANHPSNKPANEFDPSLVKIGFPGFVFGIVVYGLILYLAALVLEWQEIVSSRLDWGACLAFSAIYVVGRSTDRAFFRRQ